jgi:integrase
MPLIVTRRKDTGALTITGRIKFPDGTSRRVRQTAQSANPKDAAEEAAALQTRLLREAIHGTPRGTETFANAVDSYLETDRRANGDKQRLIRIVAAMGRGVTLAEINQSMINQVKKKLHPNGVAPATISRGVIGPIRVVMNHANEMGWCDRPRFKLPKRTKGRTLYMLPSEVKRLLAASAPHIMPLIIFLVGTGARMAEAIELDWRDVDLVGNRAIFWQTKNGERRDAELPVVVVRALQALPHREGRVFRWQTVTPKRAGKAPPKVAEYADRRREYGGHIKRAWKGAIRRAGLDPKLTPHCLRHSWASWHYAIHKDLLKLKQDGCWSSVELVERYAHLLPVGHEDEIHAFLFGHETVTDTDRQIATS